MQPSLPEILKNNPQPEPDAQFVNALEKRLRQEATSRQMVHRNKLYRWVTSCSTLAACVALLLFLLIPHNSDSFAAMQQVIRQSNHLSVQIQLQMLVPLSETPIMLSQTQSWVSRHEGIRSDISIFGRPALVLWHPWVGDTLCIDHIHKVTTPIRLPDTIDPRELLQFNPSNLIQQISRITGKPTRIESDDKTTVGFRVDSSVLKLPANANVEVWVDRASNRPVRIACNIPLPNSTRLLWTADHFAWDPEDIPEQLKPTNPQSYKQLAPLPIPTPSLDTVAISLRHYAQHSHGSFPTSQTLPWQAVIQAIIQTMQQPQQLKSTKLSKKEMAGLADALAGGIYLLRAREQGAHIKYNGHQVQLGDDRELLRINHTNGKIQTIDGNLKIKVLKP